MIIGNNNQFAELGRSDAAVRLVNLSKDYSGTLAVENVSFDVGRGEFLSFLGPSGCGKTTLMNMVAGFFRPSSGAVWIAGRDVTHIPPYLRNTGMVFQNYALFPHMTVAQNVAFGLRERKCPKHEIARRVEEALSAVKLEGYGGRRPAALSGGQQQRVALARALVIKPEVLLLDEPLSALDKNLRTQMQIEIRQIQKDAGVAAIFVTHDQGEALSLSDRIVVMSKGRVEQIGAPEDIYLRPKTSFVAGFVGDANRIEGVVQKSEGGQLLIDIPEVGQVSAAAIPSAYIPRSPVNIFVRPEDVSIVDNGKDRPNTLPVVFVAKSYQGSFSHIVARLNSGRQLLLTCPGAAENVVIGSAAYVHLDLSRGSVLPP
jgi:spermidine/putrescine ABC transporter ATP-binding subunit